MSVHPQILQIFEKMAGLPPTHTLSPEAAREQYLAVVRARTDTPTPVGRVENRTIPGPAGEIPVRIFTPQGAADVPLLVYYHGGGHVFGSPETHDAQARNLCAGVPCVVVSVDYRKAPENKFPAAADDAFAALRWAADNASSLGADPARIAVGGDSAGGNLTAVTALAARDAGGPALALQLLIYPVADYRCQSDSYERYATGYGTLEARTMHWFRDHYLRSPADAEDWRASPLLAPDMSGLPPAFVLTAQYDVLHDEGVALADALRAAGNQVQVKDYPGMVHGFFGMAPAVDGAVEAQGDAIVALREAFGH